MAYRIGVKPGKTASAVGMILGGLFVLLGIAVIVPTFGAFSRRGLTAYEVNVDSPDRLEELDAGSRTTAC